VKKFALFISLTVLSCAPKKVDLIKPVYMLPAKGKVFKEARGYILRTRCAEYIRAVEAGEVIYAGKDVENYKWVVIVKQRDGYFSVYGKLKEKWVRRGEKVKKRQIIGRAGRIKGNCGIYYELRNKAGDPVFPVLR